MNLQILLFCLLNLSQAELTEDIAKAIAFTLLRDAYVGNRTIDEIQKIFTDPFYETSGVNQTTRSLSHQDLLETWSHVVEEYDAPIHQYRSQSELRAEHFEDRKAMKLAAKNEIEVGFPARLRDLFEKYIRRIFDIDGLNFSFEIKIGSEYRVLAINDSFYLTSHNKKRPFRLDLFRPDKPMKLSKYTASWVAFTLIQGYYADSPKIEAIRKIFTNPYSVFDCEMVFTNYTHQEMVQFIESSERRIGRAHWASVDELQRLSLWARRTVYYDIKRELPTRFAGLPLIPEMIIGTVKVDQMDFTFKVYSGHNLTKFQVRNVGDSFYLEREWNFC